MAPAATYRVAGARAGVIGQLFPAVAHQLQPLLRTPFKAKKQAALRWRTAQARSIVERCTREIKALETRAAIAPGDAFAEEARRARLGELRQEAGVTEGRILLLKARQRKLGLPPRNGWVGDTQRLVETWLATEERSARVLLSLLIKSRDPWDLIRQACNPPCPRSLPPLSATALCPRSLPPLSAPALCPRSLPPLCPRSAPAANPDPNPDQDTISLLRLGSNAALVAGYAQLPGMDQHHQPQP